MTPDESDSTAAPAWRTLAEQAAHESDPANLMQIIQDLCRALDRHEEQAKKSQAA